MNRNKQSQIVRVGKTILFGLVAMVILLAFYGLPIAIGLKIFGGVAAIADLAMTPSFDAFCNALWRVVGLIGVFIVIWVIGMIPGAKEAVATVFGLGKMLAEKVWECRNGAPMAN